MAPISCCRSCGSRSLKSILDLGHQPVANALLEVDERDGAEETFSLEIVFCQECGLVQVTETIPPDVLFGKGYPYFSSFSSALLAHSRDHATNLIERRNLHEDSLVVELASNDGYLLKNFVEHGIPVLGIDPAEGPAKAAVASGVPTRQAFFNAFEAQALADQGQKADVILANNVLAHVEGINAFVEGFAILLKDDGIAEFEFPYLRDLVESCAFDTIYHEHVFYYSLHALEPLFKRHGLYLNDVERLDIHGGSLRLTVSKNPWKTERLKALQEEEAELGIGFADYYISFAAKAAAIKDELRYMLAEIKGRGQRVAAYGAAAKGATLLNYADLGHETLDYVIDRNPHKVGKIMPGAKLAIRPVEALQDDRPDYLLILAWNFAHEIMAQQKAFAERGGRFIVPVPKPSIVETDMQGVSKLMAKAL